MTSLRRLIRHFLHQQQYRRCYLHDPHWVQFRRAWWRAHPLARCRKCGAGHPLDLHHLTYVRLGHENFRDVIPLCRYDHDRVHRNRGNHHADAA